MKLTNFKYRGLVIKRRGSKTVKLILQNRLQSKKLPEALFIPFQRKHVQWM